MTPVRIWDPSMSQWVGVHMKSNVGGSWVDKSSPLDGWTYTTPFFPKYLGEGTIWQRSVSNMPIATNSSAYASWMASNINYGQGFGNTAFNTSVGGTHSIQCYVIDSSIPNCRYQYISGNFGTDPTANKIMNGWVPWPEGLFVSQQGQDSGLALFDLATGILREYYWVYPVQGSSNRWTCMTGGYSIAPKGLKNWGSQNYATKLDFGSHAVVRMHNHLGFVGVSEARIGKVNHALAYTCSNMALPTSSGEAIRQDGTRYSSVGPSWPASGGDGDTNNPSDQVPIHGQWARLPASLDLSKYRTFTQVLIKAAQSYGIVATDSNNFVHAFNGEPGFAEARVYGVDPWSLSGDLYKKYNDMDISRGLVADRPFDVGDFPWHLTEWAPRNWGKPE